MIKTVDTLIKPVSINSKINGQSSPYNILTLRDQWKTPQKEFDLQEAATSIGVQRIIDCVEEQYVEKLNGDYFGYMNQTIKTLLDHLRTKWCKVMTKEQTNATKAYYQVWVPLTTHIITFRWQLTKQQKKMQDNQRRHLRGGQNTPLRWLDVQEQLLHRGADDKVRDAEGPGQGVANHASTFHQPICLTQGIQLANSGFGSAALAHKYPPQPKQSHCCQHNQQHHNVRPQRQESQRITSGGTQICCQETDLGHSH